MPTKSQVQSSDVTSLLKARNGVLWVNSREEKRIELWLIEAAKSAGYMPFFWDCAQGATDVGGNAVPGMGNDTASDPIAAALQGGTDAPIDAVSLLKKISERSRQGDKEVWILRDLHKWCDAGPGVTVTRWLRNLSRKLPPTGTTVIVLAPGAQVPGDVANDAVVVEWPLPDREELGKIADTAIATAIKLHGDKVTPLNGKREAITDAAIGLTAPQAETCFAKSIVQRRCIDPAVVAQEKKRIIASNGMLQWIEPLPGGLDAIGGLDALKLWLVQRELANSPEAQAYGLPAPKGCLVIGLPGNGKSMAAQAVASTWLCPLVKGDLGATGSKFLGESEQNIRRMLDTVTALGRVVLWLDEIDKTLSGGAGPAGDGGVAADKLATLLTWMNDRTNPAFIFATANDVDRLPIELLRKGRWDELWYVDCPNPRERVEVLNVTLAKFKREPFSAADTAAIVQATDKFSGAEIANLVPESLFVSFADGKRALTAQDVLAAAAKVVPMVDSMPEQVARLRKFAKRARPATTPEAERRVTSTERALDL
jgi:ATPase family associated with various cellular activities (AAA)